MVQYPNKLGFRNGLRECLVWRKGMELETFRECLGFKFLFHMFGLKFLEKKLETLRFQIPLKWGELEPPLLWGVQVFIPKGSRFMF